MELVRGTYHLPSDQFPNLAVDQDPDRKGVAGLARLARAADSFRRERSAALIEAWHDGALSILYWQQIMLRDSVYGRSLEFKIVGTLGKGSMPTMLIFRRDYLQQAIGQTGRADFMWIRVDRLESIPGVIAAIDNQYANSGDPTRTESEASFQAGFVESLRTIIRLAEGLSVVVLVSIALVAASTAAMSIRERRAEMAVMRSIGFTAAQVASLLVAEAALMGTIGGTLGAGAAWVVLHYLPLSGELFGGLGSITMPEEVPVGAILLSLFIGLISGLTPAVSATRRSIIDELRAIG